MHPVLQQLPMAIKPFPSVYKQRTHETQIASIWWWQFGSVHLHRFATCSLGNKLPCYFFSSVVPPSLHTASLSSNIFIYILKLRKWTSRTKYCGNAKKKYGRVCCCFCCCLKLCAFLFYGKYIESSNRTHSNPIHWTLFAFMQFAARFMCVCVSVSCSSNGDYGISHWMPSDNVIKKGI